MLGLNDITYGIGGRRLLEDASVAPPAGARVGLVGRNGAGKTTLFRVIAGEMAPEHGEVALRRAPASAAWRRKRPTAPKACSRSCSPPTPSARELLAEAETEHDPHAHRRDPDPARRYRRACGAGARRRNPRRPGLFPCRAAAPLRRILRRLAHAGGARRRAVRRARPAAARRAHQLSRPRGDAVARGAHRALSAHRDRHQPRPRPARQRGRLDPASRSRQAHALPRRLHRLRAPAPRAPGARSSSSPRGRRRERQHLQAFVDRFRAKATKARQAQSRAQTAGQARAGRGR